MDTKTMLTERAGERMAQTINAGFDLPILGIDILALRSESKGFKIFAGVITALTFIDKIRIIFVCLNGRNQCLELLDDDEVKKDTSLKSVFSKMGSNLKYQFTGRV